MNRLELKRLINEEIKKILNEGDIEELEKIFDKYIGDFIDWDPSRGTRTGYMWMTNKLYDIGGDNKSFLIPGFDAITDIYVEKLKKRSDLSSDKMEKIISSKLDTIFIDVYDDLVKDIKKLLIKLFGNIKDPSYIKNKIPILMSGAGGIVFTPEVISDTSWNGKTEVILRIHITPKMTRGKFTDEFIYGYIPIIINERSKSILIGNVSAWNNNDNAKNIDFLKYEWLTGKYGSTKYDLGVFVSDACAEAEIVMNLLQGEMLKIRNNIRVGLNDIKFNIDDYV